MQGTLVSVTLEIVVNGKKKYLMVNVISNQR